ncbi:hypothetical protein STEG23_029285, partial [Scotinomys teguina]
MSTSELILRTQRVREERERCFHRPLSFPVSLLREEDEMRIGGDRGEVGSSERVPRAVMETQSSFAMATDIELYVGTRYFVQIVPSMINQMSALECCTVFNETSFKSHIFRDSPFSENSPCQDIRVKRETFADSVRPKTPVVFGSILGIGAIEPLGSGVP